MTRSLSLLSSLSLPFLTLAGALTLGACGDKDGGGDDGAETDADTDADTDTDGGADDTDTDTDTDGGTDADTDADTDTDGGGDDTDTDADTDTDGGPDTESDCEDGADNDGDGDIDCDDEDCAEWATCYESDCEDGVDNDDDGLLDCDDDDCLGNPRCPELDCGNGEDDDGDRAIDCADADCLGTPECTESDCDDGIDNEGDGVADCADDDCFTAPHCYESDCGDDDDEDGDGLIDCRDSDCFGAEACKETICDDGLDDDEDGGVDCLDTDCWRDTVCLIECADDDIGSVTGDDVATGDTTGAEDGFSDLDECGTSGGVDASVVWTAPYDGCFELASEGTAFDAVLRVYEDCETGEDACDDGSAEDGTELLYLEADGDESFVLVVDGASDSDAGAFALSIGEYEYPYDEAIGSVTGEGAVESDLDGTEDTAIYWYYSACWAGSSYTDALLWTAPYAGTWTFDLDGSEFDTVLSIWGVGDQCPTELSCNDDEDYDAEILTSITSVELEEGQTVVLVVGGYDDGELGDYTIAITDESR